MRVHFVPDRAALDGELYYAEREASFTFRVKAPGIPPKTATPSIALGTLEIEVSPGSGALLYVSGYCPRSSWRRARLTPPLAQPIGIAVDDPAQLPGDGGTVKMAGIGDWPIEFDSTSGWVRVAPDSNADQEAAEIATDVIVGVVEGGLHSIWLHPTLVENYPH